MEEPGSLPVDVSPAASPSPEVSPSESLSVRPPFARDWPRGTELEPLLVAFRVGNFALVRREAPLLEARALERQDEELAAHARELRQRIQPDPLAQWLFLAALLLALGLTASAYAGSLLP